MSDSSREAYESKNFNEFRKAYYSVFVTPVNIGSLKSSRSSKSKKSKLKGSRSPSYNSAKEVFVKYAKERIIESQER